MNLPDLPYGDIGKAAIGATIAGIIAICIEISRRRREKRQRFQDDNLRVYKNFLHYTDLFFDDIQLRATFMPIYRRIRFPSGERDRADMERAREFVERIERNLPKYRENLSETLTEMEVIWPGLIKASTEMVGVIFRAGEFQAQDNTKRLLSLLMTTSEGGLVSVRRHNAS